MIYQGSEKFSGRDSVISDETFYHVRGNKQMEVSVGFVCLLFVCLFLDNFTRARVNRVHTNLESSKCLKIVFMVSIKAFPKSLFAPNTNKVQIANQLGLLWKERVSY